MTIDTGLPDEALERMRRSLDEPDFDGSKYELLERIASGGMGTVYRARDTELDRDVAVKVLGLGGDELGARLRVEAKILASLEHPGIVPVHESGELLDGRPYYAMRLVRGHTLAAHSSEQASVTTTLRSFLKICEAVSYAHSRGVVHRDIKPENIMEGEYGELLVMDWGIAQLPVEPPFPEGPDIPAAPGFTKPGQRLGTPGYMAPEQFDGKAVDERADIYALGILLRWMLERCIEPPPKRLLAVAGKASAASPAGRYRTVAELGADIERFTSGQSVSAYRESPFELAARFANRNRTPITIILSYLVMRGLLVVFGL